MRGNSKTFFDNIGKFNGSMDLNIIGVLRHKSKALEKDSHKAALFQRLFFDGNLVITGNRKHW